MFDFKIVQTFMASIKCLYYPLILTISCSAAVLLNVTNLLFVHNL